MGYCKDRQKDRQKFLKLRILLRMKEGFYNNISQMEPLLLSPIPEEIEALALEVIRQSAKLGAMLHPITRQTLIELFREMNSYYSNLIEGNNTSPLEIQKALKNDYAKDPAKRALQLESIAHIEVQKLIEQRMAQDPTLAICSPQFLCWVHDEFYRRLPDELTIITGKNEEKDKVIPGEIRNREVQVGHHIPPDSTMLMSFLQRFSEVYEPTKVTGLTSVIAAAASHHRLAWIHPFLDGNGRVVRLFSDAYFRKLGIDGHGLWTMARGLARNRKRYMEALAKADEERAGDLDGRGNLSQKGLQFFCRFFLETALDQINFVNQILEIGPLQKRIAMYINLLASQEKIRPEANYLLQAALLQGEINRGEAARLTQLSERSARDLLKKCLELGLLVSDTPKGPVRLALPYFLLGHYFPTLYVEAIPP